MVLKRRSFNPKRRLCPAELVNARLQALEPQLSEINYTGNPEHKRSPGDFGLIPPAAPRPGKSLCDSVKIFSRADALKLLRAGFERGTFSQRESSGWPQNVWAVTDNHEPLEAQLDGPGTYHGYPMPEADPFRVKVLERWNGP